MSLKALRKALKDKNRDDFPAGAVIRWVASGVYNYAALKADNGRWYTTSTGNAYTPQVLSYEDLIKVLNRSETSVVEYAEAWTPVTDD